MMINVINNQNQFITFDLILESNKEPSEEEKKDESHTDIYQNSYICKEWIYTLKVIQMIWVWIKSGKK